MSSSKPTINPYYSKYDTPKPQNRFQRAVFNGRTAKVKDLISSGENVYVTTDLDESPLFMSIVRDHIAIANQILDVYEDDLQFVRQFFAKKHSIVWSDGPVFVAYGTDNISLVDELSAGMEVLSDDGPDSVKTMVILLKSLREKRVLWLRPNCYEDNVKVAKIIECIWNDGVIDLQHKGHWGRTVFDAAAIRNQPEMFCRLNALSTVSSEKLIENLLLMCRHHDDKLDFFKTSWNRTGVKFDIGDLLSINLDLLVLPAYNDVFEVFLFFMESLADKVRTGEDTREATMRNILITYKVKSGSPVIDTIIWADCKSFVQRCITYFQPNLLSRSANNEIILETLIGQCPSKFVTQLVVECFDQVISKGMEDRIVMQLIERNWLDALKMLYDRYESTQRVLLRDSKRGVQCLLSAIDGCRYNLVDYLVEAHREELTDPDAVTSLILYCSFVQRSNSILRKLLALPAADVLRTSNSDHYYKSPLYVALKFRNLENFQLLLDKVKNPCRLGDLKEDNGENLLFVAIWFKENPVDETPFVYIEEEQASLEVVDSSDDEDESSRKRARNEEIRTAASPYADPIMPDSFFAEQSVEMARIFDYLLNEVKLDYQCVNDLGETLLHVAVKHDNLNAVHQLLKLGLDPNVKDLNGDYPMHGIRSAAILNVLLEHKCKINVRNLSGETPLLAFVKAIGDGQENLAERESFLVELLNAGADINDADVNGLTVLHLVKNATIAQTLLQHGAPINAKSNEGETPLLYAVRQHVGIVGAQNLFKVFLCDPGLDLTLVSKSNVSILSALVTLDNEHMSDVLSSFTQRSKINELENLFKLHCNGLDYNGCPVLITACSEYTNSYCLDKLLDVSHLNPNLHPDYQPLEVNNKDIIQRLLDRGANVNGMGDGTRKTPLMHAIGGRNLSGYSSNFETFALLLAAGADVNLTDSNGDSALEYASRLEILKDARRTIAALILANVNYNKDAGMNDQYDTPKLQNQFQRAVFSGSTAKVKDLISSGENVYVTTDLDESPLFMSIVRDHIAIANQILDVYEDDLQFVRQFFAKKHNTIWTKGPVFVAYGTDNISLVDELSAGMEVLSDDGPDSMKTMVILLKSLREKRVLWLRPNCHADNVNVAKIIECIWNDGVIDLQHKGHWGRTVFDAAAIRNQPEIFCRLNALSPVSSEKLIESLLLMCRHHDDKLDFFKTIWNRTGVQFDIGDVLYTNLDLLVLPAYNDVFEVFLFFMESLADKVRTGEDTREATMRKILITYKVKSGSAVIDTIIRAGCKSFVQRCIKYFQPNLLNRSSDNRIILETLIAQSPSEFVTHKRLVQCLLRAIDGCRYNLVDYLVEAHREELTDPDAVTSLILYCSFVQRSNSILRKLLALPAADVLRTSNPDHYYKSPLYVALKFRNLENFQLLLDNVKNPRRLGDLKEDNGENLLFVAIWFKESPVDETPFVYIEEEQASLEVVDSSDDEDESSRKRARNEEIRTATSPYADPIMPDSFFAEQSVEMARIFDYLLNEVKLDYQCVNDLGETLLHVAVKHDNLNAVHQLLKLGLDPNVKDLNGDYPMHGIRSAAILNVLLEHKCRINVRNLSGETPLLAFVKAIGDGQENLAERELFLVELLNAGADINDADVNGLTVLHLVKNATIAQTLLQHGAPINTKSNDGQTPIHYAARQLVGIFRSQICRNLHKGPGLFKNNRNPFVQTKVKSLMQTAQSLFKVFLCDPGLNLTLTLVSYSNINILSALASLDNEHMSDVLSSFTQRLKISELEKLFKMHCNDLDYYGCPVLITACSEYTNSYCLDKLLGVSHLNPNRHPDYQPLEVDNKDVIQRLLDRGADVNGMGNGKRKTPLMHAIAGRNLSGYSSNFETFALLLASGADVSVTDSNGDSALEYASRLKILKDARRIIAALILANVNYNKDACMNKSAMIRIVPFQCLFRSY
ncbi:hypothetical protein HA402_013699 [Bradysia odoriphaga]|nr:hypothetical protein HA402_013699 [Bradysia odoriphaga]